MLLSDLLAILDESTPLDVHNLNGVGGAYDLMLAKWGATPKDGDEYGCGAFTAERVRLEDGKLVIDADEMPWCFGSYWEGDWYGKPTDDYEVTVTYKVNVREPDDQAARDVAIQKLLHGDADGCFARVRKVAKPEDCQLISSKDYANGFTDYLDDFAYNFVNDCRKYVGLPAFDGYEMFEDSAFCDVAHEIVRETIIPYLEDSGFNVRPDGTDF